MRPAGTLEDIRLLVACSSFMHRNKQNRRPAFDIRRSSRGMFLLYASEQARIKSNYFPDLKEAFLRFTGLYRTFLQRWTDRPGYCVHRITLQGNGARNGRILG